ncbi:hypothetical protein [Mesorhizobium sp.]|uniref:hypothetical protein n=1 Tax=Mesorhizobium sp. TaxID=1871066 RepID=UPI000FE5AF7D|nr:hypothetical protein [Mesorhizobium sp.]RWK73197.1 MAG: hypothetical protein EOR50_25140 [Mesorhizobium sp.]RWM34462.1 MAG: hypothetical protein EOR75_25885 [Mesorhizobium sp.]
MPSCAKTRAEIKLQGFDQDLFDHDPIEAMNLADRIAMMHEGFIQQVGTADEVYSHSTTWSLPSSSAARL